ncbi:hypothetical protein D7X33_17575 [Butyricicoccus sp. 1XD8-22]|nr:hypothetical protein D7X33_17575 [Butyricicoccus sp. 1XD8-22]
MGRKAASFYSSSVQLTILFASWWIGLMWVDETCAWAVELDYIPAVPPKSNRKNPWSYDKQLYKQRNRVERLFRYIKCFRCIFTRYDKLDVIFLALSIWLLLLTHLCEHCLIIKNFSRT